MADREHLRILQSGDLNWNAWRVAHAGVRPDLSGVDLSNVEVGAAMFHNTNLDRTILSRKNFFNESFEGASLHSAHLHFADLRRTQLRNVDLTNSNLILANLSEADLTNANLTGALIGWTIFGNNDLSTVQGLEAVLHIGPSIIGVDTIYKSNGQIAVAFLRESGVPESFIEFARDLVAAEHPIRFWSCFMSHSSRNAEFCDRLHADLVANQVRVWYFPRDARWGESVWAEIDRSIQVNDKLLLVCSNESLSSEPVMREIERCLAREDREHRNILFPISIDGHLFDVWQHERKQDILRKVVGDFRNWNDPERYANALQTLLVALRAE
jgi:TIR domain/Pentapeptide repeats (8 copies)